MLNLLFQKSYIPRHCSMQEYLVWFRLHEMISNKCSVNEHTTRSYILVCYRLVCCCVTVVEFRNIFLKIAALDFSTADVQHQADKCVLFSL